MACSIFYASVVQQPDIFLFWHIILYVAAGLLYILIDSVPARTATVSHISLFGNVDCHIFNTRSID